MIMLWELIEGLLKLCTDNYENFSDKEKKMINDFKFEYHSYYEEDLKQYEDDVE